MTNLTWAILLSLLALPAGADEAIDRVETAQPIKYIGNAESHKFHRPSCPFARIMALNKRVAFYYRRQAVASGNVPCRYCLPPVWTVVRGRILTPLRVVEPKEPQGQPSPP